MFVAVLDTCVLWPSLQPDLLLSLAAESLYRPVWSDAVLEELEFHETLKLVDRGIDPGDAAARAAHLVEQMAAAFSDACVSGCWTARSGCRTQTMSTLWQQRLSVVQKPSCPTTSQIFPEGKYPIGSALSDLPCSSPTLSRCRLTLRFVRCRR